LLKLKSYLANKFSKDTFILTTSIYSPAGIQDYGVKEGWVAETQNHPKVELWNLSSSQHLINPPKPSKCSTTRYIYSIRHGSPTYPPSNPIT
tara:strand:- start:221 stop:496 length:276 start_codon:yes stop_codon:yes gene_type:complete